jgi:hypothetical protein
MTANPSTLEAFRAADLTTDQLSHLLANRRAKEMFGPPPPLEWELRPRTTEDKAHQFAQFGRSIGADDDLIGSNLFTSLIAKGYTEEHATEVLQAVGVVWHPKASAR